MTIKNLLEHPGDKYHDFELTKVMRINELQCTLKELIHLPTGAHVMHIGNDDPENLFCLSFQTLPYNSNGVAHILEHTVLCGSNKFPIKDPFFAMNRRSLNTFMNALTGADFTCYPAATQNPKDFYNLLNVYLDAVFHPSLKFLSFKQEGHRLEFATPTDPKTPLEYKGIVFNEMKGSLSSADARLSEAMNYALFPNMTYGYNSGGDPKCIPSLTYQELIDFHKTYYHPSHCLFFFYGNMPLTKHLDFIEEHALKNIKKATPLPAPHFQERFKEKKVVSASYPVSKEENPENKTLIAFGWLTCNVLNQEEILALSVIEIVLMDTDASLLKRALLNSGLCAGVSCYIETDYTDIPVVITLKGCNPESKDKLEAIIKKTLKKVVHDGIASESIENALHRLEFYRSEITGDHTPYGLSLFFRSALIKQHGADPVHGLMIHSLFQNLRNHIEEDPHYLTKLIQKYFIDNTHFVELTLLPDTTLAAKELAAEQETLENIRSNLSAEETQKIIDQALELNAFQKEQEEEDLSVLPKVSLSDVNPKVRFFKLEQEKCGSLKVYHHTCFTNEIVYADLCFPLPQIDVKDLSLLRLFTILLTQVGAAGRDYIQNLEYIQARTGGISSSLALNSQASDGDVFHPAFHLHGKALHRYAKNLFEIMTDIVSSPDFSDTKRIKEIILKHYTALQSSFNQNALKYAINLSGSCLNEAGFVIQEWYGLTYYENIKKLVQTLDEDIDLLCQKFQEIKDKVLCLNHKELIITSDEPLYHYLKENQFYGLQNLSSKSYTPWKNAFSLPTVVSQARTIASPIAFIGKVFKTIPYSHPDAAVLSVSSFLFDNIVIHKQVREQGGAYGGGAVCNSLAGTYYFYSYRDPNIATTLQAFSDAIKKIANGHFDEDDLEEAKLEMVQGMDAPVSPGSRGYMAYCWLVEGKTDELRQQFKARVLSLTKQDVMDAIKKHIQHKFQTGKTIIFAGRELIEKENAALEKAGDKAFPIL